MKFDRIDESVSTLCYNIEVLTVHYYKFSLFQALI